MNFKLQIWDTAGQERFRTITTAYYKAAAGILLTCDMSSDGCLENAERWYNEIKKNAPDAAIILIGTKNDLEAKIPVDVMRVWANERDIPFVSSSAKTGKGVTEAFMRLLKEVIILSKVDFGAIKAQIQNNQVLIQNNDDIKKKACC